MPIASRLAEVENMTLPRESATFRSQSIELLRTMIVKGSFEPGERLNEIDLAARLGISRGPLREALQGLAAEGLVTVVPYKGSFVRTFTPKDLFELYEMRIILESAVAASAAKRRTSSQLEDLTALLESTRQILADNASYPHEHDFHLALLSMVDNSLLAGHVRDLMVQSQVARSHGAHDRKRAKNAFEEHIRILRAIGDGNAETAKELMCIHLNASLKSAQQMFAGTDDDRSDPISTSNSLGAKAGSSNE